MKKLGFGFMRLPLKNPDEYSNIDLDLTAQMVDVFMDLGFNYFDTAYMYHDGKSELAIKETVVKKYPRSSFWLTDKMPIMFLNSEEDLERIFNEQLERCGVDYFDIYHLHNLNTEYYKTAKKFNAFNFIRQKQAEGYIKHIGFSYHDNAALLDEILNENNDIEYVQLQLNYLDWENSAIQSRKCYEVARKYNKRILVMEPVKGGTLANIPEKAESLFKEYASDMSSASWAVRYAAGLEGVEFVLSGMSNMSHLKDNTSFMKNFTPLSSDEHNVISQAVKIIDESIAIPCTACQYCVAECPQDIAIPNYFALYNSEKQSLPARYSIQQVYYNNIIEKHGKASDCIGCNACVHHCPQQLQIPELLKDVVETFETAVA